MVKALAVWVPLFSLALVLAGCAPREIKPNIIFLYVDDLGWRDVGFMGNVYHETPNIDQLAKEGMVFTNAYANAPNCAPSRACLMSGQYTPRHGIYTVGSPERGESRNRKLIPIPNRTQLTPDVVTLAESFQSAGYATAHFGKWHLGDSLTGPKGQGFDHNVGGNQRGAPRSYFSPYKNPDLPDGPAGEHLTDRLTSDAVKFIKRNQGSPFFMYLSFYSVHSPIQGKAGLIQKYDQKKSPYERSNSTYCAMIETLDQNIGRLLASLQELGLEENTIVIFYSDNGPFFPVSTAAPLRGSKGMLYEGGIRVPMVVKWPGRIEPETESQTPVIGVDFYPTLLSLAGIQLPTAKIMDGTDISPVLYEEGSIEERSLYWHFPAYLEAYAGMDGHWRQTPASAVRKGDWKLIETFETGRIELFNLNQDEGEEVNLADQNPEQRDALYRELLEWREELAAPVPDKLNPDYYEGS